MPKILVLHGPNLNLLGTREPGHYGHTTLTEIDENLRNRVSRATAESGVKFELDTFQSNAESALIDRIHAAPAAGVGFIVINPAAFTHTSVAIRDALAAVAIPFIEVHLSNIYARETFRQHSYFSDLAVGVISGLGADGYSFAIDAAIDRLSKIIKSTSAVPSSNQHNN
jgi:3-dehydroquinate dehydratase II